MSWQSGSFMAVVICKRDLNPLGNGSNKENAERRKKKGVLHYDEVFPETGQSFNASGIINLHVECVIGL